MTRSEVKSNLKKVTEKIAAIEADETVALYATSAKFLNGIGIIKEIDNVKDLVSAHSKIVKMSTNDLTESAKTLGVTPEEMGTLNPMKILGFAPAIWIKDIQTRLTELRKETTLRKLKDAKRSLESHLSADDKFDLETAGIDELLAD